jgi:hypothetical protein
MTCCITEGHSSISFSSGVVSIPLRLVCFWGPRPTIQRVAGTSRRIKRRLELHHSPPSGAAFTDAWNLRHSHILLRVVVRKSKYELHFILA